MLMLTRKLGEKVVIQTPAGPIEVSVEGVLGGRKVRLGIQAPPCVNILRAELPRHTDQGEQKRGQA